MTKLTEYVLTAEAAALLGVSQNTLRTLASEGKIPMHRNPANGYRLFLQADLDRFLRKSRRADGNLRLGSARMARTRE